MEEKAPRITDTGESSTSIYDRMDRDRWPRVLEALKGGATLYRPSGLKNYFTQCANDKDPNDGIGLSAKQVKKFEAQGVLILAGVDRYALGEIPEEKKPEAPATTDKEQMDLF